MYPVAALACLTFCLLSCSASSQQPEKKARSYTFSDKPVWADEFNYSGKPDPEKWGYDLGGGGWGNNELEFYTDKNAIVDGSKLVITAKKEKHENRDYTSSRLISKNKGDFLYGRFEARMKLPSGRGTWPAFWMLPTDWAYGDWPRSGEIDIMEHVGYDPNVLHVSIHTEKYNHVKHTEKTAVRTVPTAMSDYHVYRVDWTPDYIEGYIDGEKMFSFANEKNGPDSWPFDKRFHLLFNLAVGGNWGGAKGVDETVFPAKLEVDYVRVYPLNP